MDAAAPASPGKRVCSRGDAAHPSPSSRSAASGCRGLAAAGAGGGADPRLVPARLSAPSWGHSPIVPADKALRDPLRSSRLRQRRRGPSGCSLLPPRGRWGTGRAGRRRGGSSGGGGMGWVLLGAGLLLAVYTLLRHGLRRAPPPLARPSLRGRTAIVTGERRAPRAAAPERDGPAPPRAHRPAPLRSAGGSGGIGEATALELARCGARVVLATRSVLRGEDAARRIRTVSAGTPAGDTPEAPPWDSPGHHGGTPEHILLVPPRRLPRTSWGITGVPRDVPRYPLGTSQDTHMGHPWASQGHP